MDHVTFQVALDFPIHTNIKHLVVNISSQLFNVVFVVFFQKLTFSHAPVIGAMETPKSPTIRPIVRRPAVYKRSLIHQQL